MASHTRVPYCSLSVDLSRTQKREANNQMSKGKSLFWGISIVDPKLKLPLTLPQNNNLRYLTNTIQLTMHLTVQVMDNMMNVPYGVV